MPSTIIRAFDYRPETQELDIWFTTGRSYRYAPVPTEAVAAFRAAFAKGRHFNTRIRGRYPYRELEPAEEEPAGLTQVR
jgi:hypothetical protein